MTWQSIYSRPGRWLKGNLHTHTTQSDGQLTPEQAAVWYRDKGYDFLAISDHWVHTSPLAVDGITTVAAAELDGQGYHMLALGMQSLPDKEQADDPQAMIDHILSEEGLAFIAHPYWTGQSSHAIAQLRGLKGIEVFNSVCDVTKATGYARVHWDDLLAAGHRLLGLAVDDVHWRFGAQGRGFVMVRSEDTSDQGILAAIREGAFFSSMGPTINDLWLAPGSDETAPRLHVRTSPCRSITFYASGPRGLRNDAEQGDIIETAAIDVTPDQVYLRVECCDALGRTAWSNPVYVQDLLNG